SRLGSRPVVRLTASPGRSSAFETQTRLSQAEQSMPFLVELPPHTYGMFSSDMAREIICPRIRREGSTTTTSSTTTAAAGGSSGATASGPFALVGSAVSVASEDRSGAANSRPLILRSEEHT